MRRGVSVRAALTLVLLAFGLPARAAAQDFASPAPAGPSAMPGALIERALPASSDRARGPAGRSGPVLELIAIAWDPAAELTTRAIAGLSSWRGIQCAAGFSSSGDDVVGWNAAALAIGHAGSSHGAALRALVRRDRSPFGADGWRAIGTEAGAGFWSAIGSRAIVWASAPMMVTAGEPPPLDRGLETGVRIGAGALAAWGTWSAPAGSVDAGERTLGAACTSGPLALWAEARDRPLRASIALEARRGALTLCAEVREHPALGETARVSLALGGAPP